MAQAQEETFEWIGRLLLYALIQFGIPVFLVVGFAFLCWKLIAWGWAAAFG
jgi:hypothetical protein